MTVLPIKPLEIDELKHERATDPVSIQCYKSLPRSLRMDGQSDVHLDVRPIMATETRCHSVKEWPSKVKRFYRLYH